MKCPRLSSSINLKSDRLLEQACAHALAIPTTRYSSIASILKQGLDQQPMLTLPEALDDLPPHTNVRGAEYYQ